MKNKILLFCGFFLLLIFIAFGTYAWYLYFINISGSLEINNTSNNYKDGNIVLINNSEYIYETEAESVGDKRLESVPSYNFQVKNTGSKKGNYTVYIEDVLASAVDDGCTEDSLLTRNMLKYQLKLNGNIIRDGFLSNIKDNILDERMLEGNATNSYDLKVYIHDENENWQGKHYHYRIVINNKGE